VITTIKHFLLEIEINTELMEVKEENLINSKLEDIKKGGKSFKGICCSD
jgi:hypothetical protein